MANQDTGAGSFPAAEEFAAAQRRELEAVEAEWARLSLRRRLKAGESGWTTLDTRGIALSDAIGILLEQLPADACTAEHDQDADVAVITIDWKRVPDALRSPQVPRRSR
jgi:hypothetical protein